MANFTFEERRLRQNESNGNNHSKKNSQNHHPKPATVKAILNFSKSYRVQPSNQLLLVEWVEN